MMRRTDHSPHTLRAYWIGLLTLLGVLGWSEGGYSGGPTFTGDVVSEASEPAVVLRDTDMLEANWRLEGDAPISEAFAVRYQDGLNSAYPVVIENRSPANALYVDNLGQVGLGTAAPMRHLHIVNDDPVIRLEDTTGITATWDFRNVLGIFIVSISSDFHGIDEESPFGIEAGASTASLWIEDTSEIGMGTSNPVEAVDVVRSEAASRFQLTSFSSDASNAPQFIQRRARGTEDTPTAVQDGDNLGLFSFRGMRPSGNFSGSQATMTVQATENWTDAARGTRVLFGTTQNGTSTVTTALEITHDRRVIIDGTELDVPDEVFANEYELMPLAELKAYIAAHQHLPEVANEAEVKRDGVDVGGAQMTLLKKVEELTLYTIQQQEELEALRAQNRQLQSQLVAKDTELEQRLAVLEQQREAR